jgi:hypothetical protein
MPPAGLLGEDELPVHLDLEDPARRRDEADVGVRESLLQLGRQTGGSRLVVSDDAILDRHPHRCVSAQGRAAPRIVAVPWGEAKRDGRL